MTKLILLVCCWLVLLLVGAKATDEQGVAANKISDEPKEATESNNNDDGYDNIEVRSVDVLDDNGGDEDESEEIGDDVDRLEKRAGGFYLRTGGGRNSENNKPIIRLPKQFWLDAIRPAQRSKRGIPLSMGSSKPKLNAVEEAVVNLPKKLWLPVLRTEGSRHYLKRERRMIGGRNPFNINMDGRQSVKNFIIPKKLWKMMSNRVDSRETVVRVKRGYPSWTWLRTSSRNQPVEPGDVVIGKETWGNLLRKRKRFPIASILLP